MRFIIRVLIACLLVGLFLSWFAIDPKNILRDSWAAIQDIGDFAVDFGEWALPYILTGAVIVIPIVALTTGLRVLRGRRSRPTDES